jgi:hypothetical protein
MQLNRTASPYVTSIIFTLYLRSESLTPTSFERGSHASGNYSCTVYGGRLSSIVTAHHRNMSAGTGRHLFQLVRDMNGAGAEYIGI